MRVSDAIDEQVCRAEACPSPAAYSRGPAAGLCTHHAAGRFSELANSKKRNWDARRGKGDPRLVELARAVLTAAQHVDAAERAVYKALERRDASRSEIRLALRRPIAHVASSS